MAINRLNVEHDVSLLGQRQRPHGDMGDDHLAVAGGGAGGGESAATFVEGHGGLVIGGGQVQAFESSGRHRQSRAQLAEFDCYVRGNNVEQIHFVPLKPRTGVGGAIGDAFHLLHDLVIEAAEKERVRGGARLLPAAGVFEAEVGQAALQVLRDFLRHQVAVLVAALVRFAFDVKIDPAAVGIAISGAVAGNGFGDGPGALTRRVVDADALEPGLTFEGAAVANREQDIVLRARGHEADGQAGPILRAADGSGMDIEGHRRHGQCGAGSDGHAVKIADFDAVGAHPAAQLIAFADGERDGGRADTGVLRIARRVAGLDAQRLAAVVLDRSVDGGDAVNGGPAVGGTVEGRLKERGGGVGGGR